MSTNSNRFRVQSQIETYLGCSDLSKWKSYLAQFRTYVVQPSQEIELRECLHRDALDLYFKGVFSFIDGTFGVVNNYHSWSMIKLYYAVFYFLKCEMAISKNIAFIKNNGIYSLEIKEGSSVVRRAYAPT